MLVRMWKKGNAFALLVGMQTGTAIPEKNAEFPQKVKNRTTLRPNNCNTRYLSKRYKNTDLKGVHMSPYVYNNTTDNTQSVERAQMSTADEWIKMWYLCIQ